MDGVDVRELDLVALRHAIAVVSDDVFLFRASLRENIAYAAPRLTSMEIRQAARVLRLRCFVESLPDGYDTLVGERGLTLQAGSGSAWRSPARSSPTRGS